MSKPYRCVVVTTCDRRYLAAVRSLIASIHTHSLDVVDQILVYNIDLQPGGVQSLNRLHAVTVMPYCKAPFPEYFTPVQKSYKPFAIWDASRVADIVIWLDAAVVALKSLRKIVEYIEREGVWFVRMPGTSNHHQCSPWIIKELAITQDELGGDVIASGHLGYAAEGKYASMFEGAWALSKIKNVTQFPVNGDQGYDPKHNAYRHDQALYSILAHIDGCPTAPLAHPELGATHVSDRRNGQPWPSIQDAKESGRPVYAHRKTYQSRAGLRQKS